MGSIIITVIIEMIIMPQFIEERYQKTYSNQAVYFLAKLFMGIAIIIVNLLQIPFANLLTWIILLALFTGAFYYHESKKPWMCILEVEVLLFIYTACESLGYIGVQQFLRRMGIYSVEEPMFLALATTFSDVFVIFMYYLFIVHIWKKENNVRYTLSQYVTHFIIALYSLLNLTVLVYAYERMNTGNEYSLMFINMLCIVFADMYFLYFIKCIAEKNQLQVKNELLEQQSRMQYSYYLAENQKYQQSMEILHDVKKHLNMITRLSETKSNAQAMEYAEEINTMLKPLAPDAYTDQPILNILLWDKQKQAEKDHIEFTVEIGRINLDFMTPIDVTTIFGNLLDNALESAKNCGAGSFITVKINPFHDFIVASIENSMKGSIPPFNTRPETKKKGNHGYGLVNVEKVLEKYNGNIQYESRQNVFCAKIMFN